jgi:hypothetical protein
MASGTYQKRRGLYFALPLEAEDANGVQYTLVGHDGAQITLVAPWIASSTVQFSGPDSFMSLWQAKSTTEVDAKDQAEAEQGKDVRTALPSSTLL